MHYKLRNAGPAQFTADLSTDKGPCTKKLIPFYDAFRRDDYIQLSQHTIRVGRMLSPAANEPVSLTNRSSEQIERGEKERPVLLKQLKPRYIAATIHTNALFINSFFLRLAVGFVHFHTTASTDLNQ